MDSQTVKKVARLARINIDAAKKETLAKELTNIIGWVEQLEEVNTDTTEPLAIVGDLKMRLRADKVTDGGYADQILANAPEEAEDYFVVNKVVE